MSKNLFLRVSDPFDSSTSVKLERMGILRPDGQVNIESMRIFVQIFAGLFFNNLCDFYSKRDDLSFVMGAFSELAARKDCQNTYLMISIQYDAIREPLPDPIWWLAGCASARSLFCLGFVEQLLALAGTKLTLEKEVSAHEVASCCTG